MGVGGGWEEGRRGFSEGGTWRLKPLANRREPRKRSEKKKTSRKQEGARIRCVSARGKRILERVKSHQRLDAGLLSQDAKVTAVSQDAKLTALPNLCWTDFRTTHTHTHAHTHTLTHKDAHTLSSSLSLLAVSLANWDSSNYCYPK
jgi:hypothetical protein